MWISGYAQVPNFRDTFADWGPEGFTVPESRMKRALKMAKENKELMVSKLRRKLEARYRI
jgi:hypothetical protein